MQQAHATTPDQALVQRVLEQATYFVIFSVPDPQSLSKPIPLAPFLPLPFEIELTEAPHRLEVSPLPPNTTCGMRTGKSISEKQIADQTLLMQVLPNYFQAGEDRTPAPTALLPILSQRFWMSNGNFSFRDGRNTRFSAQAAGRFFPAGGTQLWVGGVGEILQGFGALEGFTGNIVIAGLTTPPDLFANAFFFRFPDPTGALNATELPPVIPELPDPDYSDSALITLLADPQPGVPVAIEPGPDGKQQFRIVERLRLARTNIDVRPGFLKSKTDVGEVVGERRSTMIFDPAESTDPIPAFTVDSEFVFFAGDRRIGTLKAELQEARLFRTSTPELAQPYLRYAGFGLLGEGTGQFIDLKGMVAVNGAMNLDPWAISSMYMLRILDPSRSFQVALTGGE